MSKREWSENEMTHAMSLQPTRVPITISALLSNIFVVHSKQLSAAKIDSLVKVLRPNFVKSSSIVFHQVILLVLI